MPIHFAGRIMQVGDAYTIRNSPKIAIIRQITGAVDTTPDIIYWYVCADSSRMPLPDELIARSQFLDREYMADNHGVIDMEVSCAPLFCCLS